MRHTLGIKSLYLKYTMTRGDTCQGVTKKGTRCKNSALTRTTQFCAIHKPHGEHISNLVIDYPGKHYVNGGPMTKAMTEKEPWVAFCHLPTGPNVDDTLMTLVMIDPDAPASK